MKLASILIGLALLPGPAFADLAAANSCSAALSEVGGKIYARAKASIPQGQVVSYDVAHDTVELVTGAMWKSGELQFGQGRRDGESAEQCLQLIGDGR
jgi:hypothetical protein